MSFTGVEALLISALTLAHADPGADALREPAGLATESAAAAEQIQRALDLITSTYVYDVDSAALSRAAIGGMLSLLDERQGYVANGVYAPGEPDPWDTLERGVHQGIGVELLAVPGHGLLVLDVYEDGPAWAAGLVPGEAVVAMGGVSFAGQAPPEMYAVAQRLSGAPVDLEVIDASGQGRRVQVQPGEFRVPAVRTTGEGRPTVIRVAHFGRGTAGQLAEALAPVTGQAVVLDLRDNPGGMLEEALAAADLFLAPDSVLGTEVRRGHPERVLMARSEPVHGGTVAVLVNRGTAGVAELFSVALQEQGRAVLVGTPTAGRACGEDVHELDGGLRILLLDATFLSPHGRSWSGTGLWPDVLVEVVPIVTPSPLAPPPDLQLEAATGVVGAR